MNPIDELKQEHEGIELSLGILSRVVAQLGKSKQNRAPEDLEKLVEFFTVFVDACHHGKEEELLFPALEDVGISRKGGPIGVMLADHDTGRAHVRGLRGALAEYRSGNRTAISEIQRQTDAYIKLLQVHIEKENQVLFRMAEDHLSEDVMSRLEKGFEEIEMRKIGPEKHAMLHRMLEEMQKQYSG